MDLDCKNGLGLQKWTWRIASGRPKRTPACRHLSRGGGGDDGGDGAVDDAVPNAQPRRDDGGGDDDGDGQAAPRSGRPRWLTVQRAGLPRPSTPVPRLE